MFEVITNNIYPSDVYIDDVSVYTCEGGAFIILPVELMAFEAKAVKNDAKLNWSTASEKNNAGFEIEMRTETEAFQPIGFVPGNGDSKEVNHYSFDAKNLTPGAYYFRLKQIDNNGNFNYSPIRQLNFNGKTTVSIHPNPAGEIATFEFTLQNHEQLKLELLDNTGKVVSTVVEDQFANGNYKFAHNIGHLPNGVYYYRLVSERGSEVGKLIIAK